jgi:hypothetical protein
MRIADKSVSSRSNVIIRVRPRRYRLMHGDVCFGRKRSPANVFITFPPRDPQAPRSHKASQRRGTRQPGSFVRNSGRSPLISGDPAPSGPTNIDPSAVVVGCPAKTLV